MVFGRGLFRRNAGKTARRRDGSAAHLAKDNVGQCYPAQKQTDLPAEFSPEIVGLTSLGHLTWQRQAGAGRFVAPRGTNRLVDSGDDGSDGNPVGVARQLSPSRSSFTRTNSVRSFEVLMSTAHRALMRGRPTRRWPLILSSAGRAYR